MHVQLADDAPCAVGYDPSTGTAYIHPTVALGVAIEVLRDLAPEVEPEEIEAAVRATYRAQEVHSLESFFEAPTVPHPNELTAEHPTLVAVAAGWTAAEDSAGFLPPLPAELSPRWGAATDVELIVPADWQREASRPPRRRRPVLARLGTLGTIAVVAAFAGALAVLVVLPTGNTRKATRLPGPPPATQVDQPAGDFAAKAPAAAPSGRQEAPEAKPSPSPTASPASPSPSGSIGNTDPSRPGAVLEVPPTMPPQSPPPGESPPATHESPPASQTPPPDDPPVIGDPTPFPTPTVTIEPNPLPNP